MGASDGGDARPYAASLWTFPRWTRDGSIVVADSARYRNASTKVSITSDPNYSTCENSILRSTQFEAKLLLLLGFDRDQIRCWNAVVTKRRIDAGLLGCFLQV